MSSEARSERPIERPVTWTAEHPEDGTVDEVRDAERTEYVEGRPDRHAVDRLEQHADRADETPLDRLAREDAPLMTDADDPLGTRGDVDDVDSDGRESRDDVRGGDGEGLAGVHGMDVGGDVAGGRSREEGWQDDAGR